jgi:signal transduction histidine kinase
LANVDSGAQPIAERLRSEDASYRRAMLMACLGFIMVGTAAAAAALLLGGDTTWITLSSHGALIALAAVALAFERKRHRPWIALTAVVAVFLIGVLGDRIGGEVRLGYAVLVTMPVLAGALLSGRYANFAGALLGSAGMAVLGIALDPFSTVALVLGHLAVMWFLGAFHEVAERSRLAALQRRLQAEEEILAKQAQLVDSERHALMGHLTAAIVHDVKTPLAVIRGNLQALEAVFEASATGKRPLPADWREMVGDIRSAIEHTHDVCGDLLGVARNEAVPAEPIDLRAPVLQIARLCEQRLRSQATGFEVAVENTPLVAVAHGHQIAQIVLNLVVNAAQALERGGTVRLRGAREPDRVEFEVSDDGPGIAEELRERLFEPYASTKAAGQGTGLGLSVSREIARAHGGDLTLVPSEKGARFVLSLPAAPRG